MERKGYDEGLIRVLRDRVITPVLERRFAPLPQPPILEAHPVIEVVFTRPRAGRADPIGDCLRSGEASGSGQEM
jgi:hypothetical protein